MCSISSLRVRNAIPQSPKRQVLEKKGLVARPDIVRNTKSEGRHRKSENVRETEDESDEGVGEGVTDLGLV